MYTGLETCGHAALTGGRQLEFDMHYSSLQ